MNSWSAWVAMETGACEPAALAKEPLGRPLTCLGTGTTCPENRPCPRGLSLEQFAFALFLSSFKNLTRFLKVLPFF